MLVGDGSESGALPDVAAGAIALGVEETGAGVCYLLVLPALGAGA
jgi:hypothetical protein